MEASIKLPPRQCTVSTVCSHNSSLILAKTQAKQNDCSTAYVSYCRYLEPPSKLTTVSAEEGENLRSALLVCKSLSREQKAMGRNSEKQNLCKCIFQHLHCAHRIYFVLASVFEEKNFILIIQGRI